MAGNRKRNINCFFFFCKIVRHFELWNDLISFPFIKDGSVEPLVK